MQMILWPWGEGQPRPCRPLVCIRRDPQVCRVCLCATCRCPRLRWNTRWSSLTLLMAQWPSTDPGPSQPSPVSPPWSGGDPHSALSPGVWPPVYLPTGSFHPSRIPPLGNLPSRLQGWPSAPYRCEQKFLTVLTPRGAVKGVLGGLVWSVSLPDCELPSQVLNGAGGGGCSIKTTLLFALSSLSVNMHPPYSWDPSLNHGTYRTTVFSLSGHSVGLAAAEGCCAGVKGLSAFQACTG